MSLLEKIERFITDYGLNKKQKGCGTTRTSTGKRLEHTSNANTKVVLGGVEGTRTK